MTHAEELRLLRAEAELTRDEAVKLVQANFQLPNLTSDLLLKYECDLVKPQRITYLTLVRNYERRIAQRNSEITSGI